jgi:hypothetical protein
MAADNLTERPPVFDGHVVAPDVAVLLLDILQGILPAALASVLMNVLARLVDRIV